MTGPVRLTLYGREGCHLCEEALAVIKALDPELCVQVREVDIEAHDDLLARYLERIPVVAHGEEEWFEFEVDPIRLEELVRDAASI